MRLVVSWVLAAVSVVVAAAIVPGVGLEQVGAGMLVAAFIAVLNAFLPPFLAALRLPFTLVVGFILVLCADAAVLGLAGDAFPNDIRVGSVGDALLAALVISAVSVVLQAIIGTNDDERVLAARHPARCQASRRA